MWLSALFVSIDCVISSIAILLCFRFVSHLYNKYCIKCDQYLEKLLNKKSNADISSHCVPNASTTIPDITNKNKTDLNCPKSEKIIMTIIPTKSNANHNENKNIETKKTVTNGNNYAD